MRAVSLTAGAERSSTPPAAPVSPMLTAAGPATGPAGAVAASPSAASSSSSPALESPPAPAPSALPGCPTTTSLPPPADGCEKSWNSRSPTARHSTKPRMYAPTVRPTREVGRAMYCSFSGRVASMFLRFFSIALSRSIFTCRS